MDIRLKDQVAIVTGAGQGIGAAIARAFAAAGARVAVNDQNPDRAQRVADEILASGGQALAIAADVANKFQCSHLIESTRAEWGRLDILVNNAGVVPRASVLKMDEWDWTRCLDVNLKGTFFMTQLCARVMSDENGERGGAIVNIASIAGVHTPFAERSAYCASKAGMVGFAREAARELAQYNIRVNSILPGFIETPATEPAWGNPEILAQALTDIPAGRLGQPDDVAAVALFLASPAASYMTGACVTVTGGQVMV